MFSVLSLAENRRTLKKVPICFRAHSRPLYRLQVLQDAQQKHEELSHAGQTDVIIKENVEINGGSTKTKLKNDKTKKSTIVTFSDSPLIQEHKVSVSTFFREIVFVNAYYLLSLFFSNT